MQYLGSIQHLDTCHELSRVISFPIGLSPKTMKYIGSIQHLDTCHELLVFP